MDNLSKKAQDDIRRQGQVASEQEAALIETYLHAVGWDDTPLARARKEAA